MHGTHITHANNAHHGTHEIRHYCGSMNTATKAHRVPREVHKRAHDDAHSQAHCPNANGWATGLYAR